MPHRRLQRCEERRKSVLLHRARRESGQAPVLPSRIEQIRRRSDGQAQQDVALPAPGMAAVRIHADREVADQADPHTRLPGNPLGRGDRTVGHPLQELVIQDLVRLRVGKERDGGPAGITQVKRPLAPVPLRHARRLQCLEAGMLIQQRPLVRAEARKIRSERSIPVTTVQKRFEQFPQQGIFRCRCFWPVDQAVRQRRLGRHARPKNQFRRGMQVG